MKVILKINALLICAIISLVLVPVIICAIPFCAIMDMIFFVIEMFDGDGFYHNVWGAFVYRCINYIREVYCKMTTESVLL